MKRKGGRKISYLCRFWDFCYPCFRPKDGLSLDSSFLTHSTLPYTSRDGFLPYNSSIRHIFLQVGDGLSLPSCPIVHLDFIPGVEFFFLISLFTFTGELYINYFIEATQWYSPNCSVRQFTLWNNVVSGIDVSTLSSWILLAIKLPHLFHEIYSYMCFLRRFHSMFA